MTTQTAEQMTPEAAIPVVNTPVVDSLEVTGPEVVMPEIMRSPANKDLALTLFKAKEGIEAAKGVTVYEGILTFAEWIAHFAVEKNIGEISEEIKRQRDVDQTRVKNLKGYVNGTDATIFPNVTAFVSELTGLVEHQIGTKTVVEAVLSADADRFLVDGQGRRVSLEELIYKMDRKDLEDHTISIKFVVTHTASLAEATPIIRLVFSVYHVNLIKPNKSISHYFNSDDKLTCLLNELLELTIGEGETLGKRIARHGKITTAGQLWTYDQFRGLVLKFMDAAAAKMTKDLGSESRYQEVYEQCSLYFRQVFSILPLSDLDTDDFAKVHEKSMFGKAVFASAIGLVGQSLFNEMIINPETTWSKLDAFNMPLENMKDRFWLKCKATIKDEKGIKIFRGAEKRIALAICEQTRIFPCKAITN